MKVLQVLDQAYRTVVEEQDDTILWLSQSMRGAGADICILLSGHAVSYAVLSKTQPALKIGQWKQMQPANIHQDISRLQKQDVPIFAVKEDLEARGLGDVSIHPGIELIDRSGLTNLYENVDQVWHW